MVIESYTGQLATIALFLYSYIMFLGIFNNDVVSWIGRIIVITFIASLIYGNYKAQKDKEEYLNNLNIMNRLKVDNDDVDECWKRYQQWKIDNPRWTFKQGNVQVKYCISLAIKN